MSDTKLQEQVNEIKNRILRTESADWRNFAFTINQNLKDWQSSTAKEQLKASIKRGFLNTFNVWEDPETGNLECLDGKHRVDVLLELQNEGMSIPELLPTNFIECKDRKEAAKNVLIYSSFYAQITPIGIQEYSRINEIQIEKMPEINLPPMPIIEELEAIPIQHEAVEDDFDTTPPAVAKTVLGDLYEIGEHRLLAGDATCSDTVAKLMNGELADVGFNDPPYGMKKESEGVIGDNMNFDDLLQFNREWIALQFTHLKDNGSFYCWGTDEPLMDIYSGIIKPYIKTQKATFRNLITWDKGHGQGQNSDNTRSYAIADEKCLFVMCGVQGFNNNADNYFEGWETVRDYLLKSRLAMGWDIPTMKKIVGHSDLSRDHWTSKSQFNFPTKEVYGKMKAEADRVRAETKNDAFKKEYDELKKEYDELKKEYYQTRAYFDNTHDNFNNVWHFDRHVRNEATGGHATPKPIPLCERAIKSSCPDNGLVTDWFLGSGSTMVAAHQLKRKVYGCELEPKYCDVIVKRMLSLDSTLRVKRNGVDVTEEWRD